MDTTVPTTQPTWTAELAIDEIKAFAGEDCDFYTAAALLGHWEHRRSISADEARQVLDAFPLRRIER